MSHFVTWVLLPANTPPTEIEKAVSDALAPFSENLDALEYEEDCYCVGRIARNEARTMAEAVESVDKLRERFNADPATTELRAHGDDYADIAKLGISRMAWRTANRELRRFWKEAVAPLVERERWIHEAHPLAGKSSPTCNECKGSGKVKSTRNPRSKWDWWVIGGRWSGRIREISVLDHPDLGDPLYDKKRDERNSVMHNVRHVAEISEPVCEDLIPFAILAPDGEWHEKGAMGWFGVVFDEDEAWVDKGRDILAKHRDCLAVACDLHI